MRSGTKRAVVWTCGLGVLVLVGATAASWEALTERYWLWKLETGDDAIALEAAQELSRRQSVRAVRPLVDRIRATSTENASGWVANRWRPTGASRLGIEEITDVYLPPFTMCLHGIGPSGATALEREVAALEREIAATVEGGGTDDRSWRPTVDRTLYALRCVRRAWRDEKLAVRVAMRERPISPTPLE